MSVRKILGGLFVIGVGLALPAALQADGSRDNVPERVRPIPPQGIVLSEADQAALEAGVASLGRDIADLQNRLRDRPALAELIADVAVYHKAVQYALVYHEFFAPGDVESAKKLLEQGAARAKDLAQGRAPWTEATGLVVRGYVSKIDGSVQPYGLVVPPSYRAGEAQQFRLDTWCHGRGEELSEVNFITGRQSSPGEFTPADTFVLHPYGRYCNAQKFAGEVDLFEALEHVRRNYPIDENRLVIRGFSMGGAASWHIAVHHPSTWAAAAPGAGFSETPDFLRTFQGETLTPAWYERKLWHWYDCTDYALNLYNCPTVAYSGEKDRQKQAADQMQQALAAAGIQLVHVIGAGAGHEYTPAAKVEINRRIDSLAQIGRQRVPRNVHFTTWTLRYNHSAWLTVDGLEQHWQRARVDAALAARGEICLELKTENVSALSLEFPAGACPLDILAKPKIDIDGVELEAPQPGSDRSWLVHCAKIDGTWRVVDLLADNSLHKRHGLQGPIDDAFLDSFLIVRPTGKAWHDETGAWVGQEMKHAVESWRRQFRGDARIKDDVDVSPADIAAHNLIVWGDPQSNALLAKVVDRLPVHWTRDELRLGEQAFRPDRQVPVLIYPNPLNPERYIVLNSGFTYREYDYLNNARQTPKLPDFAVVDTGVPVSSKSPGRIVAAGFFDERWHLPAKLPPIDQPAD